jgi:endonuclease/exonuclease/phosphatase family metal-dependent hydrolase
MKAPIKNLLIRLIFFLNLICLALLLCSNLAPYLNPSLYWPVALTGILFPLLFLAACLFAFLWFFVKPKKSLLSAIVILTSIPNVIATFGFNFSGSFVQTKQTGTLRVLTWNVALMSYTEPDSVVAIKNNLVIFKKLRESDADIICLQEFFSAVIPGNHYNLMDSISRTLNYPYYYFSRDDAKFNETFYNGSIIFSRYKIVDSQKTVFPGNYAGSIIKAGIAVNTDTINIMTTRLQSVKFKSNDYKELGDIKKGTADGIAGSKSIINKLRAGYKNRVIQINIVNTITGESKRPVILTGDMNDVPVSYTYSKMKMNMVNAWENKGFGLGKTFKYISPTLRIDQIFFSRSFSATQIKRIIASGESDHNAVVTDLLLIKKNQ